MQGGIAQQLRDKSCRGGAAFAGNDPSVAGQGRAQDAHAVGRCLVGDGDEVVRRLLQQIPGEGARFAAAQARHDGVQLPDGVQFPVIGRGRAEEAVRPVGLDDRDDGLGRAGIAVGEVGRHGAGHGSHAGLQEEVRRRTRQLFGRFVGQSQVALHDPPRDFRISFPRRVLHQDPAVPLRLGGRETHCVIVIAVPDGCFRPEPADVLQPFRRAACRHVDDGLLPELPGRPRHTPAMVSVRRRDKGHRTQPGAGLRTRQIRKAQLLQRASQFPRQHVRHAVAAAEGFERVQTEAVTFVLHKEAAQAQFPRQVPQWHQGRFSILRDGPVEGAYLPGLRHAERRRDVYGTGMLAVYGFHVVLHMIGHGGCLLFLFPIIPCFVLPVDTGAPFLIRAGKIRIKAIRIK